MLETGRNMVARPNGRSLINRSLDAKMVPQRKQEAKHQNGGTERLQHAQESDPIWNQGPEPRREFKIAIIRAIQAGMDLI